MLVLPTIDENRVEPEAEKTMRYWKGLNRYLPIAEFELGLLVPAPPFTCTFQRIKKSRDISIKKLVSQHPTGRLVAPSVEVEWTAPTVLQIEYPKGRGYISFQTAAPMSDYRYMQLAAQRRDIIPIMDHRDGFIYDLTPLLDGKRLRYYRRYLEFAALRTQENYSPRPSEFSDRNPTVPMRVGSPDSDEPTSGGEAR